MKLIIALLALLVWGTVIRKAYTHYVLWLPAHNRVTQALMDHDLSEAGKWENVELEYEFCGLNPAWFLTGGC